MKKYLLILSLISTGKIFAQVPEDAIRYSYYPQNGSARNLAIGGAMGSLGGDITATFVNPAGLGFYKTGEIILTPGFVLNNNKANFRETANTNKKNGFGFWGFKVLSNTYILFVFNEYIICTCGDDAVNLYILLLVSSCSIKKSVDCFNVDLYA